MQTHFYRCCCLLLLLLCGNAWQGYAQLFRAGVVAGMNWSQIEGDNIGGFTKPGLYTGLLSEMSLARNWALSLEILYSQKGSSSNLTTSGIDFRLVYDYVDLPLLVKFRDPKGGLTFGAGLSMGRLLRYKYVEEKVDRSDAYYGNYLPKRSNYEYLLEGSYQISDIWSVGVRWNRSFLSFRTDPNSGFRGGQFHHYISLRTAFVFSALFKP